MEEQLLGLLSARRGHFLLESGHHGNLWLNLDALFLRPAALRPFTNELARRLRGHGVEAELGETALPYFAAHGLAVEAIARLPHDLWEPTACAMCAAGEPLSSPSA